MNKLKKLMAKVLQIKPTDISDEFSRETQEEWDSFSHLLLISEIEKELGINFSIKEIEDIKTFKDIVKIAADKKVKNG